MTDTECDGYLDEIQERFGSMEILETMAQQVMEAEIWLHVGAGRQ